MKPRKRFFKLQWSLQTMFLLTAVVALWLPYFQLQEKIERTEQKIGSMQKMARELIVVDTSKIAVVKKLETWYDENRWEIYLPDGEYAMRLATRKIDKKGFAPVARETRIRGGRYFIELLQSDAADGYEITVILDEQPAIETKESQDWKHDVTGSSGGGAYTDCTALPRDEPVVLLRRRFSCRVKPGQTTTPKGPTEGLLLWIEQVPEEKSQGGENGEGKATPPDPALPAPPVQMP